MGGFVVDGLGGVESIERYGVGVVEPCSRAYGLECQCGIVSGSDCVCVQPFFRIFNRPVSACSTLRKQSVKLYLNGSRPGSVIVVQIEGEVDVGIGSGAVI